MSEKEKPHECGFRKQQEKVTLEEGSDHLSLQSLFVLLPFKYILSHKCIFQELQEIGEVREMGDIQSTWACAPIMEKQVQVRREI